MRWGYLCSQNLEAQSTITSLRRLESSLPVPRFLHPLAANLAMALEDFDMYLRLCHVSERHVVDVRRIVEIKFDDAYGEAEKPSMSTLLAVDDVGIIGVC